MTKNKYAIIRDLVPGKNFDFFNNFGDQVLKDKMITINDVGFDWFDCLSNDEQLYVQQLPKYANLSYDEVIKQYDKDILPAYIKKQKSMGWRCNSEGNIIGFVKDKNKGVQ